METTELSKMAIAVPGSLGIILAIATFIFMAWLVRFVLKENAKREERLAGIIERDLAEQKAQIDRIEKDISEANKFQRMEHQTIISNQVDMSKNQTEMAKILQTIIGMITFNTNSQVQHQKIQ